jgi:hypothetical protein
MNLGGITGGRGRHRPAQRPCVHAGLGQVEAAARGVGTRQLCTAAESTAEQPARRILAGSGGCL